MPMQTVFPWAAFILFALTNSFTPGPNVIMFAGSGSRFGLRRSVPHLLGVCFGFPLMLLLVEFGSESVFRALPWAFTALTLVSLGYVTWLAVRIFRMGGGRVLALSANDRPMTFVEAALFQWVNGKAWQMVLMTATLYAAHDSLVRLGSALTFWLTILISGTAWIELGKRMAVLLERPAVRRAYYSGLALALLLSTWPRGIAVLFPG